VNTLSLIGSLSRNAGGLFESVRRLHQSLGDIRGVKVRLVGLRDEFTDLDLPAWAPVPVDVFPILGPHRFGFATRLSKAILEMECDLIHMHGLWTYLSIAVTKLHRQRNVPYLVSPHGMLDPWAVKNSSWKKRLAYATYEKRHLEGAGCLRALCEAEAEAMRKIGLKNPLCIIPNGVDLPTFDDQDLSAGAGPLQPLKARGSKILLYLGRIHPKKGLPNLLKGWSRIQEQSQAEGWVLAIAGWDEGGHQNALKTLASDLGILASVTFLGPQFGKAKASCYSECDAFVLPSLSEGFPMVVLEAWAYGKPVLMTPECNLPQGFESNAAIRIATQVEAIERGLQQLLETSAADRADMGFRGKKLAIERYSWPKIAGDMKEVYDWLLGGGPLPFSVRLD
jgi:glycosyltransferase involved in cell wall biosynthesis